MTIENVAPRMVHRHSPSPLAMLKLAAMKILFIFHGGRHHSKSPAVVLTPEKSNDQQKPL